jgi:hypothetical protein
LRIGWDFLFRQTRSSLTRGIKKLDVTLYVAYVDEVLDIRQAVRDFVMGAAQFRQLSHLRFRVQSEDKDLFPYDVEFEFELSKVSLAANGDHIKVSQQEYRDVCVGPRALMRGLKNVQFEGVSEHVASELTLETMRTSHVEDLTRMHSVLAAYVSKHFDHNVHPEICSQAFEYINLAGLALELNDIEVFKRIHEKLLLVIDQHHESEKMELFRHDRMLGVECNATSRSNSGSEFMDGNWRGSTYDAFETDSLRNARDEREKLNPSLILLRKIWDYSRDGPWGGVQA